jgi:hypothetical protein
MRTVNGNAGAGKKPVTKTRWKIMTDEECVGKKNLYLYTLNTASIPIARTFAVNRYAVGRICALIAACHALTSDVTVEESAALP